MKLLDMILLSLCVALLIIGVHQTFYGNFFQNYWIFMLVIGLFLWFNYRKKQNKPTKEDDLPYPTQGKNKKK